MCVCVAHTYACFVCIDASIFAHHYEHSWLGIYSDIGLFNREAFNTRTHPHTFTYACACGSEHIKLRYYCYYTFNSTIFQYMRAYYCLTINCCFFFFFFYCSILIYFKCCTHLFAGKCAHLWCVALRLSNRKFLKWSDSCQSARWGGSSVCVCVTFGVSLKNIKYTSKGVAVSDSSFLCFKSNSKVIGWNLQGNYADIFFCIFSRFFTIVHGSGDKWKHEFLIF